MHSSLVATREGLPLGLAAIKFWNRDKFHGTNALKRRVNPTRVPIEKKESFRWLENMRQSTALFADPNAVSISAIGRATSTSCSVSRRSLGTHFLVAPAWTGGREMANIRRDAMKQAPVRGLHRCSGAEQARGIFYRGT